MILTNNHNLPEAIVRAARRDDYSRGDSRASVTQLINSPRIDALRSVHYAEMSSDVCDRIWSLLGTAVHHLLHVGADVGHVTEERLFADVGGWRISGGVDVQDLNEALVRDYKVTSIYSVMYDKPDWERQLNSYAYLVRINKGIRIERLEVCAILRDWRRSDAERDALGKGGYPKQPIVLVPVRVWSDEEQETYLLERVRLHQEAAMNLALDEELAPCSDEDRWQRDPEWAVFKPAGKRAWRVYKTEQEAYDEAATMMGGRVEKRHGKANRCEGDYCGVARFCSQWAEEKKKAEVSRGVATGM